MKSLDAYVDALVIHLLGEWIAMQVGYNHEKQRAPAFYVCDSVLKETLHAMRLEAGIHMTECAGRDLARRASLKAIEAASKVEAAIEKISLRHPNDPVVTFPHIAFKYVPVLRRTVEICGMSFRMETSNFPMPCTVYSTGQSLGYLKILVKHAEELPMVC